MSVYDYYLADVYAAQPYERRLAHYRVMVASREAMYERWRAQMAPIVAAREAFNVAVQAAVRPFVTWLGEPSGIAPLPPPHGGTRRDYARRRAHAHGRYRPRR